VAIHTLGEGKILYCGQRGTTPTTQNLIRDFIRRFAMSDEEIGKMRTEKEAKEKLEKDADKDEREGMSTILEKFCLLSYSYHLNIIFTMQTMLL
jgi:hypothetical protein